MVCRLRPRVRRLPGAEKSSPEQLDCSADFALKTFPNEIRPPAADLVQTTTLHRPVLGQGAGAAQTVSQPGAVPVLQEADHDRGGKDAVGVGRYRKTLPRWTGRNCDGKRGPLPPARARRDESAER